MDQFTMPFFDYRPQLAKVRTEVDEAIARVLDSGRVMLGPEVRGFEEEFARFTNSAHAIGTGSGTDALILALLAYGIGAGDQVIVPNNVCPPTPSAIRAVGAEPVFCDVEEGTAVVSLRSIAEVLTPRTRAVIPVHLYGKAAPVDEIAPFVRARGIVLIEDCAQALGTRLHGRHVGTFGEVGCFSFYPTKNLGAFGDAGACITMDAQVADRLRSMRQYGFDEKRCSVVEGRNFRLDELHAAMLRVLLTRVEENLMERQSITQAYLQGIESEGFCTSLSAWEETRSYHLFVGRTKKRAEFLVHMRAEGVPCAVHYATPLDEMPAFERWRNTTQDAAVTRALCQSVVSLPLYPGMSHAHVAKVIEAANSFSRRQKRNAPVANNQGVG